MVNVATEELVPYLKTAIDLESSVYTQQKAIENHIHLHEPNKSLIIGVSTNVRGHHLPLGVL